MTDPHNPSLADAYDTSGASDGVTVDGLTVFVGDGGGGLIVLRDLPPGLLPRAFLPLTLR